MFRRDPRDLDVISGLEFFRGCSRTELSFIRRMATLTEVRAGTELCRRGERGLNFYVLVTGGAQVAIDGYLLGALGPGCGFGEIALLSRSGRRIASVTTTAVSRLIIFSRPEFATLMVEVPGFASRVLSECHRHLDSGGREGLVATS